jgi:polyisoprenoid-binding protein YceI
VVIDTFRAARAIAAALALLAVSRESQPQRPIADALLSSGTLSFDARANVGDFTGTTSTVTGALTGGGDFTAVRGWVETPVRSLKTGNEHRDRDLNKSMDSDRYPMLRFELAGITPVDAEHGDSAHAMLHGAFTAHGVTRDVDVPASIIFGTDSTAIRGDFPLNLKEFKIGGLAKFLGIFKMDEHIVVHVALAFRPSGATSAARIGAGSSGDARDASEATP